MVRVHLWGTEWNFVKQNAYREENKKANFEFVSILEAEHSHGLFFTFCARTWKSFISQREAKVTWPHHAPRDLVTYTLDLAYLWKSSNARNDCVERGYKIRFLLLFPSTGEKRHGSDISWYRRNKLGKVAGKERGEKRRLSESQGSQAMALRKPFQGWNYW